MKTYIGNKLYCTYTADYMGRWASDIPGTLTYCEETLYRKKTGEYFIHGTGGLLSRYGNKEKIIPLDESLAKVWANIRLDSAEYEAAFGNYESEERHVTVNITLKASTVEKAKRIAAKKGICFSAFINNLLEKETKKL